MTTFTGRTPEEQTRLETAAAWHLELRDNPSSEFSVEFQSWTRDSKNRAALRAVEESWLAIEELSASPEILDMRRGALNRARRFGTKRWLPRSAIGRAAAALILVATLGGGAAYAVWRDRTTYVTDIGERRVVSLPDGSRVSMDADSRVRVHYSENLRALVLDRGRARFDVAHNVTRPFTVSAGGETVVAIGTSFSVERLGQETLVTLIQGEVAVKKASSVFQPIAPQIVEPIRLLAGQELVAIKGLNISVQPVNLQAATAWEGGQLVFKDEPLGEAVQRVNRYSERRIGVSPSVRLVRISGVFNAGDIEAFVSAVTSYLPVQSTMADNGQILLESKP